MLTRINHIRGTGLFESAEASPAFTRATLVFGENGRGKSTLAALLRSAIGGESDSIAARRTLGSETAQSASFDVQAEGATATFTLRDGAWSGLWPDLVVFDAQFVARNVYAGQGVSPDQRASLLNFALGETAVEAKTEHESITNDLNNATRSLRDREAAITHSRGPFSLSEYRNLSVEPDLQTRIDAVRQRAMLAREIARVRNTPGASIPGSLNIDIEALFTILHRTIEDVSESAAVRVQAHVATRHENDFEGWLAQGTKYMAAGHAHECPFCGTEDFNRDLITAYGSYFNEDYKRLKQQAAALPSQVETRIGDQAGLLYIANAQRAVQQLGYWRSVMSLPETQFDETGFQHARQELTALLKDLAKRKANAPLESVGTQEEIARAHELLADVQQAVNAFHAALENCNEMINEHKRTLQETDIAAVEASLKRLEIQRDRHAQAKQAELSEYDSAVVQVENLNRRRDVARARLDNAVDSVFASYGQNINSLLASFGAQMTIRSLRQTFRGQIARTEYELVVRGVPVPLNATAGAHFGNTLSEGDKRALAYAFFLAKLTIDPQLSRKTVLIDDPVCSFDWNRKSTTIRTLLRIGVAARQLIVFGHDAWFLRDLGSKLANLPSMRDQVTYLCISANADNTSKLTDFDIEGACRSRFAQSVETIASYVADPDSVDPTAAARAIRPVLEGYLRSRFPLLPPKGRQLGEVIEFVKKTDETSPYHVLTPLLPQFIDINDYTLQFMHEDGQERGHFENLVQRELITHCNLTLSLISK